MVRDLAEQSVATARTSSESPSRLDARWAATWGSMFATSNGGGSWARQDLPPTRGLPQRSDVHRSAARLGDRLELAAGELADRGFIIATSDGGARWSVQLPPQSEPLYG